MNKQNRRTHYGLRGILSNTHRRHDDRHIYHASTHIAQRLLRQRRRNQRGRVATSPQPCFLRIKINNNRFITTRAKTIKINNVASEPAPKTIGNGPMKTTTTPLGLADPPAPNPMAKITSKIPAIIMETTTIKDRKSHLGIDLLFSASGLSSSTFSTKPFHLNM